MWTQGRKSSVLRQARNPRFFKPACRRVKPNSACKQYCPLREKIVRRSNVSAVTRQSIPYPRMNARPLNGVGLVPRTRNRHAVVFRREAARRRATALHSCRPRCRGESRSIASWRLRGAAHARISSRRTPSIGVPWTGASERGERDASERGERGTSDCTTTG